MNFNKPCKISSVRLFPILLICFCLIFSSCANSSDTINEHTLYLSDASDSSISGKTDFFFFIIPKDASPELIESTKELCKRFCEGNVVSAKIYFDDEPLPIYENPRFILIGNTVYSSSQKAISHLKRDDYVCLSIGKDVVIGGKSNSASIKAIERFTKETLMYFDGESGISEASSFSFFAEYPHENLTINGYSLSDYTFVYPYENSIKELELTYLLREKLADMCGAYPKIVSDKDIDMSGRLICVGNCFDDTRESTQIDYDGKCVKLFASSENSLAQATQALIKECETTKELTLRDITLIDKEPPAIDFVSIFPNAITDQSSLTDIVNTCKEIKSSLPMLVCFDFPSDTELEQYEKNLTEYIHIGNGLFVLKSKNNITSSEAVKNISCADVTTGDGFDYRIIISDIQEQGNIKEAIEMSTAKISDRVATVLFTVAYGETELSFDRNDIIFASETSKGNRRIYVNVFSPSGAASIHDKKITINHSILKEAIDLNK